jgi:hypothetical protein
MNIIDIIEAITANRLNVTQHARIEAKSVWAYAANSEIAVLITVYRPDPDRWVDWKVRKPG